MDSLAKTAIRIWGWLFKACKLVLLIGLVVSCVEALQHLGCYVEALIGEQQA